MKKTKIVLLSIIFLIFIISNNVYGSFADYTDEDATKDTEKLIEEYNKNHNYNKSSNNYLKSLEIEEGELSPGFDKQILNYNLVLSNDIEKIKISACSEDDNANINGIGTINIREENQCKIEVTSESGTVRTYFINIIRPGETPPNDTLNQEEIDNDMIENDISTVESNNLEKQDNKNYIIITSIIIAVILIISILVILIIRKQ